MLLFLRTVDEHRKARAILFRAGQRQEKTETSRGEERAIFENAKSGTTTGKSVILGQRC